MEKIYTFYQTPENIALINFQVCGITYPDKSYSITRNKSGTACIEFVENGSGTIIQDNQQFEVNAGDSYFLHENRNQHYYANPETPWKKYWVNISGTLLDNLENSYKLKDVLLFKGLDIKNELLEIINITKNSQSDNTSRLVCLLTTIFHKMYDYLNEGMVTNPLCESMREFIDFKASGVFRLDELCRHVSLSESQTIRLFKENYNKTPYAYFIERKISLAKNLLRNTNLPIKQIAAELCFADEYYFSNFFKQKNGVSPRQYRYTTKNPI